MRDPRTCEAEYRRLYAMLKSAFSPTVLAGWESILFHLRDRLRLRDLAGRPITWRRVYRWTQTQGFPLVPGVRGRRTRFAALTTDVAIQAWFLSRPCNGFRGLFRVDTPEWQAWREARLAQKESAEKGTLACAAASLSSCR